MNSLLVPLFLLGLLIFSTGVALQAKNRTAKVSKTTPAKSLIYIGVFMMLGAFGWYAYMISFEWSLGW